MCQGSAGASELSTESDPETPAQPWAPPTRYDQLETPGQGAPWAPPPPLLPFLGAPHVRVSKPESSAPCASVPMPTAGATALLRRGPTWAAHQQLSWVGPSWVGSGLIAPDVGAESHPAGPNTLEMSQMLPNAGGEMNPTLPEGMAHVALGDAMSIVSANRCQGPARPAPWAAPLCGQPLPGDSSPGQSLPIGPAANSIGNYLEPTRPPSCW